MNSQEDLSKLSYGQMNNMASELNKLSGQMREVLDSINNEFAKIGEGGVWSGTAASETKRNFDELSKRFPLFADSITACSKQIATVVANYQAVDKVVAGQPIE